MRRGTREWKEEIVFAEGSDGRAELCDEVFGECRAEVEAAWAVIEQMLSKRNIAYGQGTHHHYVMHAAHLFNHFGVAKEDLLSWAAQNWCDYEHKQRESIIHWVYQNRQHEYGCWRLNKAGRPKEVSMITLPEIRLPTRPTTAARCSTCAARAMG